MRLHLAIIDDCCGFATKFKKIIQEQIQLFDTIEATIDTFTDSSELLERIQEYHCVFLDVEMPTMNGIALAQTIRREQKDIFIIFVSSFTNYVFKSFEVNPFTYIVKSEVETRGIFEIQRLLQHIYELDKYSILYVDKSCFKQKEIAFIEKYGNECELHYKGELIKVRDSMKHIANKLAPFFIQVSKSEIINFHFVERIQDNMIMFNDGSIHYISRRREKEIREQFFSFLKKHA